MMTLYERFHGLRQWDTSMEEYTTEFLNLSIHVGLNETDEQLTARYVSGLKISIRDEMGIAHLSNLKDAYQLALMVEELVLRFVLRRPVSNRFNNTSNQRESAESSGVRTNNLNELRQPQKSKKLKIRSDTIFSALESIVEARCLVHFSMGADYKDEAWYNVLPIDACYILLVNLGYMTAICNLRRTWKKLVVFGKPISEATWISENELKRVDPGIYEHYAVVFSSGTEFSNLGKTDAGQRLLGNS
ncbi:hypothetical protein M9H77_21744 [Catharanthus roseus]|uniref:Uncharacterized protein n=1 Tax=Catharanthus roseus TaxID=4058 RepID=A0ACC0AP80_CATRO|nr:hypothetical protein M9H77_21744 [Catharanthus roseus]